MSWPETGPILILEDDPISRKILEHHLRDCPTVAFDTVQGLINSGLIKSCRCILADYALPDGTALDVLSYMGAESLDKPVILVTKYSELSHMSECWSKGAFDFLEKPVTLDSLLEILRLIDSYPGPFMDQRFTRWRRSSARKVLDVNMLRLHLAFDERLLELVLREAINEIPKIRETLAKVSLHEDALRNYETLRFQLHAYESMAQNLCAGDSIYVLQSITAAIKRGELIQLSDLRILDQALLTLQRELSLHIETVQRQRVM